jgi:methionine-rich copper-binding protein CopC
MQYSLLPRWVAPLTAALLAACAGNGEGLDANGQPITEGSNPDTPLSADFQSIQDNVFTPICVRCHSGAAAPEGLQLDEGHSYALLVGVSSGEMPNLDRVKAGDPDSSYLVQKLEGAPGIAGARMPKGGPYLPQSTIDVIRQWITNGAQSGTPPAAAALALTATWPAADARMARAPQQLVVAFSREIDFSLVNETTLSLEPLAPQGAVQVLPPMHYSLAAGNPATVLMHPATPLANGTYRLHVRGTGPAALADLNGSALGEDAVVEFTVEATP